MRTGLNTLTVLTLVAVLVCLGCGRGSKSDKAVVAAADGLTEVRQAADAGGFHVGPAPEIVSLDATADNGVRAVFEQVFPADYNGDGVISGLDMFRVTNLFRAVEGDEDYDERVDGNGDGRIDGMDLFLLSMNFGRRIDGYNIYTDEQEDGDFTSLLNAEPIPWTRRGELIDEDLPTPAGHLYVSIRPVNFFESEEGESATGEMVDGISPVWQGDPGTIALEVVDWDSLYAYFNEAVDHHSNYVRYRVMYGPWTPSLGYFGFEYITTTGEETDGAIADRRKLIKNLEGNTCYRVEVWPQDKFDNFTTGWSMVYELTAPPQPKIVSALPDGPGAFNLTWEMDEEGDDATIFYEVYLDTRSPIPFDESTRKYGPWAPLELEYRFANLDEGERYYFEVIALTGGDDEVLRDSHSAERSTLLTGWTVERLGPFGLGDTAVAEDGSLHVLGVSLGVEFEDRAYLHVRDGEPTGAFYSDSDWKIQPRLTFKDGSTPVIYYNREDLGLYRAMHDEVEGWVSSRILEGDFWRAEYVVPSGGGLAVKYVDDSDYSLNYTEWNGSDWELEQLDYVGYEGGYGGLALTGDDEPVILIYNDTFRELTGYHRQGGEWTRTTLLANLDRGFDYANLRLVTDPEGVVRGVASYGKDFGVGLGGLLMFSCDGTGWQTETVRELGDFTGTCADIQLAPSGHPALLYQWGQDGELLRHPALSTFDGSVWTHEIIWESFADRPQGVRLEYDAAGPLAVIFDQELFIARP